MVLSGPVPARAVVDHLECFKVADPLVLKGVVDVDVSRIGTTLTGCKLGSAKLYCVPATRTVISANVPVQPFDGRPLLDDRICYALRCRNVSPFSHVLEDQFGSHTLGKLRPRLLCTPAVAGPPLPPQDMLDETICYGASDPARVKATVTLGSPQLGTLSGCQTSRARLFCTGAHTTIQQVNVAPLLPIDGTALDDDRLCYSLSCPKPYPGPQLASDQFGSRTFMKVRPGRVCTPALNNVSITTSTSTTTSTVTTTTFPPGTDQALICQRAIETGGLAYANAFLDGVANCTQPGAAGGIDVCLANGSVQSTLATQRTQWGNDATAACHGVDVNGTPGYPRTCAAAPSTCTFPSGNLDTGGSRNHPLDCLACRIQEELTGTAVELYANHATTTPCSSALGDGARTILAGALQTLDTCSQQPAVTSIAACFAADMTAWRTQAESTCAGVNPFDSLGYPATCSGLQPVFPDSFVSHDPPCTFSMVSSLSTAGGENDLLDCLECRTQEAVL